MLGSVRTTLISGTCGVFCATSLPTVLGLVMDHGSEGMGLKLGALAGAAAFSAGIAYTLLRVIAAPLHQAAADLAALAAEAKTNDTIDAAQRKLDTNLEALRSLLYGRGDPRRLGDALYFGDYRVNGSNEVVDKVQSMHGGSATIFLGDTRISTNIKDKSGNRPIGTRLAAGPAFDATLKEGRTYRGEAEIFGEIYITIYEPILFDREVIGLIFVAVTKADAVSETRTGATSASAGDVAALTQGLHALRDVTNERQRIMKEALEQRYALADARRKTEAVGRAAATAQRDVVNALSMALEKLAGADLTHRIELAFPSEYQKLKDDFGSALAALRETMQTVMAETKSMLGHSTEIAQAVDELSRRTEQQAASLEETAAALDLITATVQRTAAGVDDARQVVSNTKSDAEHSSSVVRQAVQAMSAIEESSRQIARIIGVIDDIALQTNLLALNAGVEAARAGEAGRGFAVVASEVRALAQRSAEAAKEIKDLISASTTQVNQGVSLVGETGRSLERIVDQVTTINEIVAGIAGSAQEQAMSLQEVNTAISHMDQVTQQNAAMVEESTAASHQLAQEAGKLEELVSQFQTGLAEARHQAPRGHRTAEKPARAAPAAMGQARPAMKVTAARGGAAAKTAAEADWEEF